MSLATLLTELPSKTPEDIEALFQVHYERRAPIAKAAVTISKHQDQLLYSRVCSSFHTLSIDLLVYLADVLLTCVHSII